MPEVKVEIKIKEYEKADEIFHIIKLIQNELSEPYSIYTYRYFLFNWPHLSIFAKIKDEYVGVLVAKLEIHKKKHNEDDIMEMMESTTISENRGYIAMLSVNTKYRNLGIGKSLVKFILL